MTSPQAKVDVIIPVHNEARWIGECLQALLDQSYPSELVTIYLVDNASTDSSAKIIKDYASKYKNVEYLFSPDGSVAHLRNQALEKGDGEFLAFLDAHCIAEQSWIENFLTSFLADSRIGGCLGQLNYMADDRRVMEHVQEYSFFGDNRRADSVFGGIDNYLPWMPSGNVMFRRTAMANVGFFDEDLYRLEDVEVSWRVFLSGYSFSYCPEALVTHHDSANWRGALRRYREYGIGNAQLSKAYDYPLNLLKASRNMLRHPSWGFLSIQTRYIFGCLIGLALMRLGRLKTLPKREAKLIDDIFRPVFLWQNEKRIRISKTIVYWHNSPQQTETYILNTHSNTHFSLDYVATEIWIGLERQESRQEVVSRLVETFQADPQQIEADVDDFISAMLNQQCLECPSIND